MPRDIRVIASADYVRFDTSILPQNEEIYIDQIIAACAPIAFSGIVSDTKYASTFAQFIERELRNHRDRLDLCHLQT